MRHLLPTGKNVNANWRRVANSIGKRAFAAAHFMSMLRVEATSTLHIVFSGLSQVFDKKMRGYKKTDRDTKVARSVFVWATHIYLK